MKRVARPLAVVIVLVVGAGVYVSRGHAPGAPQVSTETVTEGNVVQLVTATGTVAATRTVDVGTLVSGVVRKLDVDFNSVVHAGDVIAELDTATFQTQLVSARAAVDKGQVDLASAEAMLAYDTHQLERTEELLAHGIASEQDVTDAHVVVVQDQSQVLDDRAAIKTAAAARQQADVNLAHCTITSPVDGVVISRNVDQGQTVASSAAASSLYVIATDLSTLDVLGNIDEADVAKVRPGEEVRFTVATYPKAVFHGTVTEVRLTPIVTRDVVIYQAVIRAPNPDLRLLPGMTANLLVEASESDAVPRVANVALRFRPTSAVFAALHEPPPAAARINGSDTRPAGSVGNDSAPPAPPPAAGGTVIDRLFAPTPPVNAPGQVWVFEHEQLRRVPVRLGVSDGTWTALAGGDLIAGELVVTGIVIPGVITMQPARVVAK